MESRTKRTGTFSKVWKAVLNVLKLEALTLKVFRLSVGPKLNAFERTVHIRGKNSSVKFSKFERATQKCHFERNNLIYVCI